MEAVCHRCGGSLVDSGIFCPHCGAPQLRVQEGDEADLQQPAAVQRSGTRDRHKVSWKPAITSALLLAVPLGLISGLVGFSIFLLLAGGFAAVALYRRNCPSALADGQVGWRIGAVAGLLTSFIAALMEAGDLVIHRYFLHNAGKIDQQFQTMAQQVADSALKSGSEGAPQAAELLHHWVAFWLSPDGHAAIQLLTVAIVSFGTVLFAAAGGALGARILAARERTRRAV
ncbi:hypothetical protein [Paracidobacterium acidisoli]|uniref:Zinc ribbon domain-containing protein n=1 Tax=Paracidobacterium acidisoli TaxID=2303751 RepID=A0A372IM48_9BACT|nr:hypothetical protein [Paracidobacterium acidisoli]MBT9331608.1 hydrogenase maturation nickel metallochaperone HypA [Paracidobacterium acidisoli]